MTIQTIVIGYSNWELDFGWMADFLFDNSLFVGKDWRWGGTVERVNINGQLLRIIKCQSTLNDSYGVYC
jgi:hypothetical protein